MTYEQKDGEGVLFKVDEKKSSQHPDLTGNITVGGVSYWLSGWRKQSKDGKKQYLSLSARPKQEKTKSLATEPPQFEDDTALPF